MFNLGMPEMIVILVIALLVFGPGKLPEMGKAMGNALQEFRRATSSEQIITAVKEPAKPQLSESKK
ncbi:MAG: twin-arginine translocation protein TatA/E family subunit [Sporomusa sp.]|jgi:sec-independent protein translocase protein TatA|nr:twin-arginine translocation protein TatA/E family subunit [Sporomusa sp.]